MAGVEAGAARPGAGRVRVGYAGRMGVARVMRVLGCGAMMLAGLGGCRGYAAPSLSVTRVQMGERTADGMVLVFEVEAENRNAVELPLREVRYTLRLDGRPVFSGVRSPEATLRRLGVQRFSFPAVVALGPGGSAPEGEVSFELDGVLSYTTPGQIAEILFDSGLRRPSVSFRDAGRIDLATP